MPRVSLDLAETGVGSEEAADRRRATRAELIVRVDYATVDEIFSEFTRDINEGGLFIETDKPGPVGSEVTMHFNLPGSSDSIRTIGTIVRTSSGDFVLDNLTPQVKPWSRTPYRWLRVQSPGRGGLWATVGREGV